MDQKYFINAFAALGDKATIPEPVQPTGDVSFTQGFTFDYQRQLGVDPLAKAMPRDQTNYLFFTLTEAVGQYQRAGIPEFITSTNNGGVAFPYDAGVAVRYRALPADPFTHYVSLVSANTATPGSDPAKWQPLLYAEASQAEAEAGVSATVLMTPRRVKEFFIANPPTIPDATETTKGKAEIATTAEAQGFTDDTRIVTPLKLGQAIPQASTGVVGRARFATVAETTAGALANVATTPAGVKAVADTKMNAAAPAGTGSGTMTGALVGSATFWTWSNPGGAAMRCGANGNTGGQLGTTTNHPVQIIINNVEALNIPIGAGAITTPRALVPAGGFQYGSSRVLKDLEGPMPYGLAELLSIETAIGSYKKGYGDDGARKRLFVIAEQLREYVSEPVFDEVVEFEGAKAAAVDYIQLIPFLIKALQEENAQRIEEAAAMRTEIAELRSRLDAWGL